jgi:hypothetical protein
MNTRTPDLFAMLRETIPVRVPGRPQSAESIERDKGFAERAAELAKLRTLRLQQAVPADATPGRRKRTPK